VLAAGLPTFDHRRFCWETAMAETVNSPHTLVEKYTRLLKLDESQAGPATGLEARPDGEGPTVVLSTAGIADTVGRIEANLNDFARRYFPGKDKQASIAAIRGDVQQGLEFLQQQNEQALQQNPQAVSGLEIVVLGDGTRPMYLIANDEVDFASANSLVQQANNQYWISAIQNAYEDCQLREMMPSVGILLGGADGRWPFGTGFLVGPNLLLTNKHVWQGIDAAHRGRYHEVTVDFRHEFQGQQQNLRRRLASVAFVGLGVVGIPGCVDLALLTLEPDAGFSQTPFQVHAGIWSRAAQSPVFVIGHPKIEPTNPYKEFLGATSGFKRLCPGIVPAKVGNSPMAHDASTTDGCSGGVVLAVGYPYQQMAVGIHFGTGTNSRHNLAHALTDVLDQVSEAQPGVETGTLREILDAHQATLDPIPFS
jgi:hypothetical protein